MEKQNQPLPLGGDSIVPPKDCPTQNIPILLRIFGILSVTAGGGLAALLGLMIIITLINLYTGSFHTEMSTATLVISGIDSALTGILAIMFVLFGIRLLCGLRRNAARIANTMIAVVVGIMLCEIMLRGFSMRLIPYALTLVFLIVMQSYLDPSLAQERELRRKLRDMEVREAAEEGTLGRDETGKGFIALNFFNLFWIFVVCCVIGLIVETLYHLIVVDPGHLENRTGLLFGPFSPIYGFGGMLMTVALNRFHDKNIVLIFLVSALIGGAFEYLTSWFMQFAFGIIAWDYSGTFLSIDGRTNFMFMCMWGVLGVGWIKYCLPWMLKLVNLIPWNWRYTITTICAALMILDGAMTLLAMDRWYQRMAGNVVSDSAMASFFDKHFDNTVMSKHFQTMSIDPRSATRTR